MTRYAHGRKSDSKRRIVREASRLFRRKGSEGVGVAAIMDAAGLTHGGFYAHFSSKEQLLRESIVAAFEDTRERHIAAAQAAPREQRLATVVQRYLAAAHRDEPADGCALAALASDIPRHPKATRAVFARGVRSMASMLSDVAADGASEEKVLGIVCTLVGSLQLARAVDDPTLSDALLAAGRSAALAMAATVSGD
jgi:TetR/AcrR family transcriptional repressor of nem operon